MRLGLRQSHYPLIRVLTLMIPTPLNCGCTVRACVEMRGNIQLDWAELKCECNTALVHSVSPGVGHPGVNAPLRTHIY